MERLEKSIIQKTGKNFKKAVLKTKNKPYLLEMPVSHG